MDTDVYVKRVQKIKSYVNLIKKNFECSICIDFFEDPVITNCQHAFCKKCIENYIGSKRSQNCPLCKSAVNLRSLRSFTTLSNFVQKAKKLEEAFEKDLSNSKLPNSTISSTKVDETPKDAQTSGENEPTTSDEANKSCSSQKRKRVQSELINAPTCLDRNKKKKLNANSDTEPTAASVIEDTLIIQPNDQSETSEKHQTQPLADKTNQKSKSSIKITRLVGAENAAVEPKTIHFFESTSETAPSVEANIIKSVAELDNAENCPPPLNDDAAAIERENNNEAAQNKNDYPLKFRKENSDISEQFTVLKGRPDNNINNQQINNATTPFNRNTALKRNKLSKSCGVNSNRVKIVEPIDRNKSLIEVHLNEPVAVVDPPPELNLLFDNNNSNHKSDNNQAEENQNQIQLGRVDDTILLESETINSRPCEKCARRENKKDAWTSMESAGRCEIAIQVDEVDIISSRIDLDGVVDQLADDFYQHLENFMVNTIIEKYLESLIPLVIPDSPPHPPSPQQPQPPLPPPPNEPNEAPTDRRSVQVKATIPNESFSDLLETSVVNQSTRRKSQMANWGRKKPPTLEFISSNRSNALNQSVNLDSSVLRQTNALSKTVIDEESEKQQAHVEFDEGEDTDKSHDLSKDSLIIDDTPVKTDNEQFRELDRRLSISATRMQAVNFIFPENNNHININYSNNSNSKSVYSNSETPKVANNNLQLPISMIITDTIQPNKQEDDEEEGSNVDEPTMILNTGEATVILTRSPDEQEEKPKIKFLNPKPHPAPAETHSFLLNTLNSSNSNLTLLPDTNNYMNASAVNGGRHSQGAGNRAPPPLASDILGVSYIHTNETTMNVSAMTNPHESSIMKSNRAEKQPAPSRLSQSAKAAATATNQSNKRSDMETQLLTDSAMMKIDDICKDLYSAHNLTVNEGSYQMTSKSTGNSSASSAKFEFVFSLLKPEMKVVVKNYAKIIRATIANDVTETTTHLIVDSDENLRCGVTSKYLKAISRKIWIVSVAWILNSINLGQFLKPDKFEIKGDIVYGQHNGPANSRLTKRHLFGSYEFLFIGDFSNDTISLDNLIDLSMLNGASVKRKAKEFSENDPTKTKVILFDETKKRISTNTVSLIKQNGQIECVNKSWLLDSLACYEIRHFSDYETYETVG